MSSRLFRLFFSFILMLLLSRGYITTGWAQTSTDGVVITVEVPEPASTSEGEPVSTQAKNDDGMFLGFSSEPWLSVFVVLLLSALGAFALGGYRSKRSLKSMKGTLQSIEQVLNRNSETTS